MKLLKLKTLSLILLLTNVMLAQPSSSAPPVFDGRDGLTPSLSIYHSEKSENPQVISGHPLWRSVEYWDARGTARDISVVRMRFSTRQEAIQAGRSYTGNPLRRLFVERYQSQWDTTPVLGQRSASMPQELIGLDCLMFVYEKQLVTIQYQHSLTQNSTSWQRTLQIGQTILSNIQARRESGEGEPDPDQEPPSLSLSVNPPTLWPPNGKMVKVQVQASARDNLDPSPVLSLVNVTSSDGGSGDIQINSQGEIWLRASRAGKGQARVYTITYQAKDGAGNTAQASTTVTVPHDQRKP